VTGASGYADELNAGKVPVIRALTREEEDRVYTRWSDAYPPAHEPTDRLREVFSERTYTAS